MAAPKDTTRKTQCPRKAQSSSKWAESQTQATSLIVKLLIAATILITPSLGLAPISSPLTIPVKLQNSNSKAAQQQREQIHYKTTYACEGKQLDLSCAQGKSIHLVRANYGRFSLSICNEMSDSNLSVQCASFRAFLIMEDRCNKLSNCSVKVSTELFGDPCEGTSKYLEVQYLCDDVSNSSASSSNQQQITNSSSNSGSAAKADQQQQQMILKSSANKDLLETIGGGLASGTPSSNSLVQPQPATGSQNINHKSQVNSKQVPSSGQIVGGFPGDRALGGAGSQIEEGQQNSNANSMANNGNDASSSEKQSSVIQPQQQLFYCSPQTSSRNLFWNFTKADSQARQNCPEGSLGKASWFCDSERLRFSPAWSPDFTQCRSIWLQRLAQQLDQMLEVPSARQQQQAAASNLPLDSTMRLQNEQILKVILTDLALMAKTKELFSEDLKRIDIMISQIISQLKSLSAQSQFFLNDQAPSSGGRPSATLNAQLYEELFNKLVNIVSSLFDLSQRNAWLDLQSNDLRRKLEFRFLNHLKEAGLMLANNNNIDASQQDQSNVLVRQANIVAGIIVINSQRYQFEPQNLFQSNQYETFNLQQQTSKRFGLTNRLFQSGSNNLDSFDFQLSPLNSMINNEFRIHPSIIKELSSKDGFTRFLVFDIKKPDYLIIRQQLESTYATLPGATTASSSAVPSEANSDSQATNGNNLMPDPQWLSRVFGLFPISSANDSPSGDIFESGNSKMFELLTQWPISVDFKISPQINASPVNQQQQQQALSRQCNLFTSDSQNRCQTFKANSTNHVCRCDLFGFVTLTTLVNQQFLVPTSVSDFQWPPLLINQEQPSNDVYSDNFQANGREFSSGSYLSPQVPAKQSASNSLGIWTTVFVVFGLSLLVISVVGFIISTISKATNQNKLAKKQANFLATTGPLSAEHSLIGDTLVTGSPQNSSTTHSTSIIGLSQATICNSQNGYKTTNQQLYAAHLPQMDSNCRLNGRARLPHWLNWLRPARVLSALNGTSKAQDKLGIHHSIVGSSLTNGSSSISYKSHQTYQNGYTANMHHPNTLANHQQQFQANSAGARLPTMTLTHQAPSSSTSSYVSSSAYYEEIGPGNLTKVNANQLQINRPMTTIVDPFKKPAQDQQQLIAANQWSATNNATLSYQHHHDLSPNQQQQQQQQSSSSSAGSQHSTSTNLTNVSTPRHYLFASPSAVNAYKTTINQPLHYHQHHQHQQFKEHQRFMPNQ